jgi:RHH-type rel operon transcriptional repressor/antitoxin RelB
MSALSIELPEDIEERLQELAQRTGRSEASYVLEAVVEYLGDLEDIYIAEQRLADIRSGRSMTITLDELERNLGLAD